MEFGAAESKSLIRRKTVKVSAGQPELLRFTLPPPLPFSTFKTRFSSRISDLILKQAETCP